MKFYNIFGISFISGGYQESKKKLDRGALMVVPSAPGLATVGKNLRYTEAVQNADIAIPDSGYMVLLIRLIKGIKINKFSGYDFLKNFFKEKFNKCEEFTYPVVNVWIKEKGLHVSCFIKKLSKK